MGKDTVVLLWVAFVFFAAVFFAITSSLLLYKNKKTGFAKSFHRSVIPCLFSILLSLSIWPPVHRVYDDEFAFISQSVNIVSFGKPGITLKGSRVQPDILGSWAGNPKLPGFAYLESILLFLTNDHDLSFFLLNLVLGAISAALIYRMTWLLTLSDATAWWSAVFFASLPARITYSMSASSDIAGLFFFLLFFLFTLEFKDQSLKRILYAAVFCGLFSICIKPFYTIPVFLGLAAALFMYRKAGLLDKKTLTQIGLDLFCLSLPIVCAVPVFLFSDSKAGAYSFLFMFDNLRLSAFYLFNSEQSAYLTALAAAFAILRSLFYKRDELVNIAAGWLLLGLLVFSVFNSGGISYPGHAYSDRYFLLLAFPFVFLAARAAVDTVIKIRFPYLGLLLFVMLAGNAYFASRNLTDEANDNFHFKKILLLKTIARYVPYDAYIIDESAATVTAVSVKRSIQTDVFLGGDHPRKVIYLQGIAGDLYSSNDPGRMKLLRSILNAKYKCVLMLPAPVKLKDLSATPVLCTLK